MKCRCTFHGMTVNDLFGQFQTPCTHGPSYDPNVVYRSVGSEEFSVFKFSDALKAVIPKPCYHRPFVCDGNPERCDLIVIGENPTTQTDVDWWSFWTIDGFDYLRWQRCYETSRVANGLSPVSNTRRRLNRRRAQGVYCLETNVFMNERPKGPGVGATNVDLLDVALSTLPNLRYVIAHGCHAHKYLAAQLLPGSIRQVYKTRHFSKGGVCGHRQNRRGNPRCLTTACSGLAPIAADVSCNQVNRQLWCSNAETVPYMLTL
jgi:hypothetical protein